jgi:ubiquinone/menaquinone biosynthesis C-methylase UbiE
MLQWSWPSVGDLLYLFRERGLERKFRRRIRRGVLLQEPRFRPITRISPDIYEGYDAGSVEYAHIQRYDFASQFVKDLVVLNAASGAGYGNEILRRRATKVIGLDYYEQPLRSAKEHFPEHFFVRGNILDLSMFRDHTFDAVVSFETIEHLLDPVQGVRELSRILKCGGHFVGSIPIQIYHNPGTNFTYEQVKQFTSRWFPGSTLFLQDNFQIIIDTPSNWKKIRFQGDKYLLLHWVKPGG